MPCGKLFHTGMYNDRRRVVEADVPSEQVFRVRVFIRDRWVCQICGLKTDRRVNRTEAFAPVLDHIYPLVRGGSHTYENVQCAHRICNQWKHAKVAA